MIMLTAQCDELREKAKLLRVHADGLKATYVIPSTKELMMLTMLDSATRMERAADTIEDLRDRMQNQAFALGMQDALGSGTCKPVETETLENVTAHVMECDKCGHTYEHVNGDYERCPRCGRAVER